MDPNETHIIAPGQRRARASASNRASRFDSHDRLAVADGWDIPEDAPSVKTEVRVDATRSIIARNTSPDVPFDRSINPYRGCEHGCIYCFARPTHAYLGLSPGLDFETRLLAKPNAPALLRQTLARKAYVPQTIAMGTNTDPYQPVEKRLEIMRGILEVLRDHNHPLAIVTKGALIRRDIDILGPMAAQGCLLYTSPSPRDS